MKSNNSGQNNKIDALESSRSLLIEQMEERVLFDAVPIAPVDAPVDAGLLAQLDSISQALTADTSIGHQRQQQEQPKEIVFVDKSVERFEQVVAEFIAQRDVEVFFINDSSAGFEQIANHLQGRNDLNAIHIVSHGNDAQLNLGDSVIGTASLSSQYLNELVRIGQSLNENGDILIYGCDLASSVSGEAFIKEFSQLTNADVAASDDYTGAVADGGDWVLEKQIGSIEADTLSSRSFEGRLLVTDAGFTVGTAPTLGSGEIAVVPVGQPGSSSYLYSNAATAGGGAISIDVRLTLFLDARNSHTGYGLSTKNFSATPIALTQPDAANDDFTTGQDTSISGNVITANNGNGIDTPIVGGTIADQSNLDADSIVAFDVSSAFSDDDGDPLTYVVSGLPKGLTIDFATGLISGVIDGSASVGGPSGDGIYNVDVTATDDNGQSVSTTFAWTVDNPVPVAGDDSFTTNEDAPLISSVTANDSDADNDVVSYFVKSAPTDGTLTFAIDGSITYTPDADFLGVDNFEYEIRDVDGACTTAIVTITVNSVNEAPVVTTPVADQSSFDSDVVFLDLSSSFSDPEDDLLTFSETGLPRGLTLDPSTGVISGTIDGSASTTGPYTVVITVADGNGGTVTDTFRWTVANPAPIAQNDTFATAEDIPVSGTVATNDSDVDDSVTFSLTALPSNGVIIFKTDGSFTYTPDTNFIGFDSFEYELCDADGACVRAAATIAIGPVNDPPVVASPMADQVNFDSDSVTLDVGSVFTDPEGDNLTFSATGLPPGLTMNPGSGVISGVIDSSASVIGTYVVVVTAEDANGGTTTDTFNWTVSNPLPVAQDDNDSDPENDPLMVTITREPTPVNDAPVAEDDYIKVTVDTTVTFNVLGANDTDPEGDPLAVVLLNSPAGGTASVNPDGTISFVPDTGFAGIVHVHYLVEDPSGATSDATLTIEVEPEFRFDSYTNFSINHLSGDRASHDSLPIERTLTKQIFSLAPEPIFSGYARPGTQIVGRVYDASGTLIGEGSAHADPGGNWLIQFQGTRGFQFYRVEFDQVAAVGSAGIYGYFGLNPADNSYQAMEALTSYGNPLSVEFALFDSFLDLQQSNQHAGNPLGFRRPEANQ